MDGKLPEIYWYLFWIGLVLIAFGSAYMAGRGGHQARMKALDILKMYAEKGAEPPPAMMEQLARQALEPQQGGTPKQEGRGALIRGFIGFVFTACVSYAVTMWLTDANAPNWAIYAGTAAWAFFAFGAFGLLLAALFTREK
jgi:hypothetical protein